MRLFLLKTLLTIRTMLMTTIAASSSTSELLLGAWSCESGDCPDEEISFSVDRGKFVYNSWLHLRPSTINGSWQLQGKMLTINHHGRISTQWLIIEATPEKLFLQRQGTSELTIFEKI